MAEAQDRVLTLAQLRDLGVTRGQRRAQVDGERWAHLPRRGVVVHRGPLVGRACWYAALVASGCQARLGGITALQAMGLTGYEEPDIHIWVRKSARAGRPGGVVIHESRRWTDDDAAPSGIPRARAEVATVQAALWSVSVRQATLAMVMPIQQRLVRAEDLGTILDRVRRHPFRNVLRAVLCDIADGAQSMGELDFTAMCRVHGLPEPTRQAMRKTAQGRIYLDVYWEQFGVTVEINGAAHDKLDQRLQDELRSIDLQQRGDAAVQVSVVTLRCEPEPFFARLSDLLRSRGWPG